MNKLVILGAIIIPLLLIIPHAKAQTSDFSTGYSDGNQQGLSDRHANVFHIGNVCINQSNSYCNGYLSGYLDGFFATLPTNTHTTIIVRGGGSHPPEGCHDNDNMTRKIPCPTQKCPDGSVIPITDKCPKAPTPPQQPNPGCNAVVGGPPCGSPSSTPSSPPGPSSSGSSSSGSSSSGSSSGSSGKQPTKLS